MKMIKATEEWHLTEPKDRAAPLRIQVLRVLLEELLRRATKLKHAKPEDDLIKTLIQYQCVVMDERQSLIPPNLGDQSCRCNT